MVGSGRIYDATLLHEIHQLPHRIVDATWKGGLLVTFNQENSGNAVLKTWNEDYEVVSSNNFSGIPLRCFNRDVGFVLVVEREGNTEFIVPGGGLALVALELDANPGGIGSPVPQDYGRYLLPAGSVLAVGNAPQVDTNGIRYVLNGWTGSGSIPANGTANPYVGLIASNSTLTWQWDPSHYHLSTETSGLGEVDLARGWYPAGSLQTLTAIPGLGSRFIRWLGDVPFGSATSITVQVSMDKPLKVTALFAAADYQGTLAGDWPMFGRDPQHTGHVPGYVPYGAITQKWSRTFDNGISEVAVGGGRVYLSEGRDTILHALSESDGTSVWQRNFIDASSLNPPAYDNGSVYVQRVNHRDDTQLW
ncbi:MAG: hypothetical protein AAF492_30240, partial [Verrucomicrobiota bacterium]